MGESKNISNISAPYKSSWIDSFSGLIQKLPGETWGYYSALGVFFLVLQILLIWIEGGEITSDLHPVQIFLSAAIPYILVSFPYFNSRALSALETIKPALDVSEEQLQNFAYRLSNLPAGPTFLVGVLALLYVFFSETIGGGVYQIYELEDFPISMTLSRVLYLICWWCFITFCYHTIHQLRLINIIYTRYTKIDLFHMKPLYGFSNLTALKSGSLVLLPIGFLYLNPSTVSVNDPIVFSFYLAISIIAFLTFLLPQIGIHHLQNAEKDELVDEINKRYKATMYEIHNKVDIEKYEEIASLDNTLNTLISERKTIESFSTWPWQPETIRWLFSAMILPLLLWIAQYFMGQWFGI